MTRPASPPEAPGEPVLPWEVWKDLTSLTRSTSGHEVRLRSSASPDGSRFDRHAPGDSRFIRVEGDEGVIFEEAGAGAITRIWMTQGENGVSRALDPRIRIRIRLDGHPSPVIDLPLPKLFGGKLAPFVAPLVGDRLVSSGGNYSYVPIPYRRGCKVSLVGAQRSTIYFQVTYHRLADGSAVHTFTGQEDLDGWAAMVAGEGRDPWPNGPYPTTSGSLSLAPRATAPIVLLAGPDTINGLLLRVPASVRSEIRLIITFDGESRVEMSLVDFFGGQDSSHTIRSALIGAYDNDDLYCYFPMPFYQAAVIELERSARRDGETVDVEYAVRRLGRPPAAGSALFGATRTTVVRSRPGQDLTFLELEGRGRWVGLSAELASVKGGSREYLEGDERVYVDGATEPAWHGTGIEDFFGGGYYFRLDSLQPVPFGLPLHGMVYDRPGSRDTHATAMYRLMLSDAVPFTSNLRAGFEAGPENDLQVRLRSVAYYYLSAR